jgi:hypothetical protein
LNENSIFCTLQGDILNSVADSCNHNKYVSDPYFQYCHTHDVNDHWKVEGPCCDTDIVVTKMPNGMEHDNGYDQDKQFHHCQHHNDHQDRKRKYSDVSENIAKSTEPSFRDEEQKQGRRPLSKVLHGDHFDFQSDSMSMCPGSFRNYGEFFVLEDDEMTFLEPFLDP